MIRFVLSTIGTSILTNLIDRGCPTEGTWFGILRDSANLNYDELTAETEEVINALAERALEKLMEDSATTNCRISAELNGIYGIYGGQLPTDSNDEHYLICTDTAQGQKTGALIKDFLESQGFTVGIVTPPRLSTQDPESFTMGTKELIKWLEDNVPWRRESGYHVIFNLVGGFKSLQGYMNTFGAFYADEVVYIFESPTADLIKIPRLPIQIDATIIEKYLTEFALMDAGKLYPVEELEGISETLLEFVEENGTTYAGLSAWGELLWNRTKSDLLSEELLQFPRLVYQQSFINDCKNLNNQQWTKLQETLAKIAAALENSGGDISQLNQQVSGLNFEQLTNLDHICTFRITRGVRVSCEIAHDGLTLRHYGNHDDVYDNP
ncbi:MAG: putative CRISPR-associated protein [Candidatus Poribacteria bacterium]|nr:putative CRISPR-associated protein [Candidatus Poribacteria bacterium]